MSVKIHTDSFRPSQILAALLCALCGTSIAFGAEPAATLSFGRLTLDQPVREEITFNNPTQAPLKIEHIEATAPMEVELAESRIEPGDEGRFVLRFGLDRKPGPYQGTIRIYLVGEANSILTFEVTGEFLPPVEFEPFPAFFLATHAGQSNSASLDLNVHMQSPLRIKSVNSASTRYSFDIETIEEGQRYRLTLKLDGTAPPGSRTDQVQLITDPPLPQPLTIQVNTLIREPVYHFPDSIDMGALPLRVAQSRQNSEELQQILMVYRPGTTDFKASARTDLDFISIRSEPGPQGDRFQFTLTLDPARVEKGEFEGVVEITTNDPRFPILTVPVTGSVLD